MLRIYYQTRIQDQDLAKKDNRRLADAAKNTIKEYRSIDVYSSVVKRVVGYVKNPEAIRPGWGGVEFEADDEIEPATFRQGCLAQEIVEGKIIDTKHGDAELDGIVRIVI